MTAVYTVLFLVVLAPAVRAGHQVRAGPRPAAPPLRPRSGTVAGISSLAARKQAVVHFPWPLSPFMRHVVRHLPAAAYDALVGRMAGRTTAGATREGDGRG